MTLKSPTLHVWGKPISFSFTLFIMKTLAIFAAVAATSVALVGCGSGPAPVTADTGIAAVPVAPPVPADGVAIYSDVNGFKFNASTHHYNYENRRISRVNMTPGVTTVYPMEGDNIGGTANYAGPFKGVYSWEGNSGRFQDGTAAATVDFDDPWSPEVSVTLDTGKDFLPRLNTSVPAQTTIQGKFDIKLQDNMSGNIKGGFTNFNGDEIVGAVSAHDIDGNPDNSIAGAFAVTKTTD